MLGKNWALLATLCAAATVPLPAVAQNALAAGRDATFEPYSYKVADGTVVEAERGELWVPENRNQPNSRRIKLVFVRFASTNAKPSTPIVYLSGGPGTSGVESARGRRMELVAALRNIADVILFDQRGTGSSNVIPRCDAKNSYPLDQPLTRERMIPFLREQAATCMRVWKEAGVDLAGYNTWESAADLDALREAIGAQKITLWGISYGTHLGLAALKRYPDRIDKAVFASIEDLHETVKLPALTDAYFARVQTAINADPRAASRFPDIATLMRGVHDKLERTPEAGMVKTADGGQARLVIGKLDMQLTASYSISDPADVSNLLTVYENVAAGNVAKVAQRFYDFMRKDFGRFNSGFGQFPSAMGVMMDMASGITADRVGVVQRQARTSLLDDMLNFPVPHLVGAYDVPDLGDAFRAPFRSDVPTLFLSGTLDGRTYPESAAETASRFKNGTHLLIENSGHNLFMVSPEVTETIVAFLRGEPVKHRRITLPTPTLVQ